jgi:hypothetical protein
MVIQTVLICFSQTLLRNFNLHRGKHRLDTIQKKLTLPLSSNKVLAFPKHKPIFHIDLVPL